MSPVARELFLQLLDLPRDQRREALVTRGKGIDPVIVAQVARLLDADDIAQQANFMTSPTASMSKTGAVITEGPGSKVGSYKILQLIGEGGFGSVFLAEQHEPVRRRVALKIIKLGMDTRQVIARFEAERQALALMDHPHIARVLDGGATETGRPYFVMEYVIGDSITKFADAHALTVKERLDLFQQVCSAVQHAHTKGIIHRDLKPGNVLVSMVDAKPFAKVIDFGIAKATAGGALTDKTLFTEHKQLIGTPEYMSPEQAEGSLDIDTRTDVYSLGVLLYELLTGTTPIDGKKLRSAAFDEMRRMIRDDEPLAPSMKLSRSLETLASTAAARKAEPGKLSSLLKGELDWIVLRALEKERGRRYETASALAEDVKRHLAGEAVVAAPVSTTYRVRKFVRTHKGPVGAVGAVVLAIAIGGGGSFWQWKRAEMKSVALRAAKEQSDTLASVQALTMVRLSARQSEFTRAAKLLKEVEPRPDNDLDRRWAAWELARTSREVFSLPLAERFPAGQPRSPASTDGGSAFVEPDSGDVLVARDVAVDQELLSELGAEKISDVEPDRLAQAISDRSRFVINVRSRQVRDYNASQDTALASQLPLLQDGRAVQFEYDRNGRTRVGLRLLSQSGDPLELLSIPEGVRSFTVAKNRAEVAAGVDGGVLRIWDVSTSPATIRATLATDTDAPIAMAYSADGNRLCTVGGDWVYREYIIAERPDVLVVSAHTDNARRLEISPDGDTLISVGYDGFAKVWSLPDLTLKKSFDLKASSRASGGTSGHVGFVGPHQAVFSNPYGLSLYWDMDRGDSMEPIDVPTGCIALAASVDLGCSVLASDTGPDRTSRLHLVRSFQPTVELGVSKGLVASMELDSRTRTLFAATAQPTGGPLSPKIPVEHRRVEMWNLDTGQIVGTLNGHAAGLRAVKLSPDGKLLAVASRDGTATVWDWQEQKLVWRFLVREGTAHRNIVTAVAFHPTEPVVATLSHDARLMFWSLLTGRELATVNLDDKGTLGYGAMSKVGPVKDLTFTTDGRYLLVTVLGEIWRFDLRMFEQSARSLLTR